MFDVTGALPAGTVSTLPRGASVLVMGPSMSGTRDVAIDLLTTALPTDEAVLWIETKHGGRRLEETLLDSPVANRHSAVGVLACTGSKYAYSLPGRLVEHVASPSDLTGISIAVAKLRAALATGGVSAVRHGLHSLSTLIHYLDTETVFKFLHIFTGRIATTGELGVFTLDDGAHDPQTVNTIASEFDGIVEIRRGESTRELRVRGFDVDRTGWLEF